MQLLWYEKTSMWCFKRYSTDMNGWMLLCTEWLGHTAAWYTYYIKKKWLYMLYFPALLVTNLEVLAGRLDWAAITGCIKRRVRRQTLRISPLEVKIRGFSALRQLGGTPLFSCLAALWGLLGAGGWAGCYRRSPGAAPGPFGWAAEVNLNCDYNVHGEKSRGASDGEWRRWRWKGKNGYNEGGFVG